MKPFKTFTGKIAVIDRGNIDTDQIISKEHLKSIQRTGFGEHLFSDWRYLDNGRPNPDFELNKPQFKEASILVAGNNFGCGSSREHAVWAIDQYGFKTVIAPKKGEIPAFADIFFSNSGKNGLLLIELGERDVQEIMKAVAQEEGLTATIDLDHQKITLHPGAGVQVYDFSIDPALKERLMKGLDDIGQTEQYLKIIEQFEAHHATQLFT